MPSQAEPTIGPAPDGADASGAAAALAIAFAGHLPRIRVEERTLREALGASYERHASDHAGLLPGVW